MKIVIPIAGRGSRFLAQKESNADYINPKPLINVMGKPMVWWALKSLPFAKPQNLIFIALDEHQKNDHIVDVLKKTFSRHITVILIPDVTRGALETVLRAKKELGNDDMIVSDCDHFFNGDNLLHAIQQKTEDVAGIIPVFKPQDDDVKWSYTLFDSDNRATAVAEKDPRLAAMGAYANIGAYYFSHAPTFVEEAESIMDSNEMFGPHGKQEFFVAPLYDRLIKKNMKIKTVIIDKVWGLGTPQDLEYFTRTYHATK